MLALDETAKRTACVIIADVCPAWRVAQLLATGDPWLRERLARIPRAVSKAAGAEPEPIAAHGRRVVRRGEPGARAA